MLRPAVAPMMAPRAVATVLPLPLPNWFPTTASATPPRMVPAVSFSLMVAQPEARAAAARVAAMGWMAVVLMGTPSLSPAWSLSSFRVVVALWPTSPS